ncbi:VCBS repeat-containing protein, partial [Patescibacteria group bacterium]|nr:VCBS repeat-containing protein [Patescibacteria group bacterium]
MKKKEDIKKRSNGEKPALIHAELFFILFFIFLFHSNTHSQININGFGKTSLYSSLPGYSNILQLNFNGDDYSDIMLFDPAQKRFVIHKGQKENTFSKAIDKFFFYSIDNIKLLQNRTNEQNLFLFVSRKERKAGLSSFTQYGTLQLLNLKNFDSYPSNISVADYDLNGAKDALISGESFNGLTILTVDKLILKEKKIITKKNFSGAEFIDLNFDGFPDIAAIDLVDNSIKLYINNREEKFVESNTIKYLQPISNLKICNINNDDFNDIAFIKNNEIEILLGDSVSSFENKLSFEFSYFPLQYEINDLNSDEIQDLILINSRKDRVEIFFMDNKSTLPKPEIYFNNKKIASVKILQRGNAKRLAAVSLSGELFITGKINRTNNAFNFAAGSSPKLFTQSNKTHFIIYGNKDEFPSLNILTGNSLQRFQKLTSIPLMYNYINFVAEDKGFGNYNFYLYNNKSLEVVSFSEFDYSIEKKSFVPFAPPIDIRIVDDSQIESKYAHILFNRNGVIGLENIEIEARQIISQGIDIIDSNVVNAIISNGDYEEIHYWKHEDSILTFNSVRQYEDIRISFTSEEFYVSPNIKPEINFSFIGSENKNLISQVNYNDRTYFYYYNGKKFVLLYSGNQRKTYNFNMPEMLASV